MTMKVKAVERSRWGALCFGKEDTPYLFPALDLVLDLWQLAAVEDGFLDASAFLLAVVVEKTEGITP